MGDHICGGGAGGGASGGANSIDAFTPLYKGIHDKISVPPVDTAMASPSSASLYPSPLQSTDIHSTDRSYSRQPLTPLSFSSGSRSVSPRTPGARPSIGRADDYFAPSIASDDQNPSQTRRSGGYGGFGDTELYPAYAPASPQKKAPSLLNRMDDIAPGPFGSGQSASPPRNRFGGSPPRRPYDEVERPGTSASSGSNGAGSMGPPRVPRKNGYGGFGPPQRDDQDTDSFGGPNRSKTFPRPSEELEPPLRTPSAPGPRPDRYDKYRNPSTDMSVRMGPVTTRAPPPRTSLVRPPTSGGNAPSINLAEEFGDMNPYHSPSVSVSSSLSQGSSQPSYPSSSTSPARSTASARKPSNTSGFDNLMSDIQASMDELSPREMNQSGSPERRQAPMNDERYDPAIQGGRTPSPPSSRYDQGGRSDPAIQGGLRSGSSPLPPAQPRAPQHRREPTLRGSRGNCKGCGDAIVGKSISSADGRLSGRYHKACFVCTECREPFQTAEFYVHEDQPYCKRHYHQVNGSVCGSCRDGIEGQYLEDESTKKYHVQCFRCGDCNVVLRDGYFDVDGRAYCEKDAFRRLQPQTYRRSPSMSSQRSYGSSNLAPPGRPGMRGPPPSGPYRPGMPMGNGRLGPPMGGGPGRGLAPSAPMPRMEKRRTRLGMM